MADFIPVENTAFSQLVYQDVSGKRLTNGLYWHRSLGWATASLGNLNLAIFEAWQEGVQSSIHESLTLVEIKSVDLTTAESDFSVMTPDSANVGTLTGTPNPLHTAMTITFRTEKRGKSYRGRVYHPVLNTGAKTNGRLWNADTATAIAGHYNVLAVAVETDLTCEQVVVSRQQGNVVLAVGETTPVSDYVGRRPIATVRLRVSQNG